VSPTDHVSASLDAVLARFGGMVRAIGARYGLPDSDLDELVQEVRLRLWSALGTSERIDAASSCYLYRASVSAAIDVIRRGRGGREVALEGAALHDAAVDEASRPDRAAERTELAEQVERALGTIPRSREAVVRMYLAGYGSGEIAELMGWSEAKARNLVYRGLADLRARLASAGVGRGVA
jgi:RNA polymerase sigma-70 factor (ECF subfamily)